MQLRKNWKSQGNVTPCPNFSRMQLRKNWKEPRLYGVPGHGDCDATQKELKDILHCSYRCESLKGDATRKELKVT